MPRVILFVIGSVFAAILAAHPHNSDLSGIAHDVEHAAERFVEGDIEGALPILETAVVRLREANGPDAGNLVVPLGFLGASYLDQGRAEEALVALTEARRISVIHDGADNARQLPLIYVQAEALKALGRTEEAEQGQLDGLRITRNTHGADSLEAALALGQLAEWKAQSGEHDDALILFSRAIDQAQSASGGVDSPDMLPLLQGMAKAFLAEGFVPGRALPLVERVVSLTDAHRERYDASTRIEARLLFGDLLMRFSLERQAVDRYREAWQIAESNQLLDWLDRLATPESVAGSLKLVDHAPASGRYFVFRYDLRADGRPSRVRLVDSNSDPMMSRWAVQRFREVRFRPPMIDGQPRPLAGQTGTFIY